MLEIRLIQKKDFGTARKFVLKGMHFDLYTNNRIELYFYSKYFWYLTLIRATNALGAYENDRLAGVLVTDMKDQPKIFKSTWYRFFVSFVSFIMKNLYDDADASYNIVNNEMLESFVSDNKVDGEIICFAADPVIKGKGIGTVLLNEMEQLEKGKTIYLFTDTNCTFQFYQHRGFKQNGRKDITIEVKDSKLPLTCFMFSKKISE